MAKGETERGRRIVHQIKGIAGNIGARAVHEATRALELAIQQGSASEWPALIDRFDTGLQELRTSITKLPASTDGTAEGGDSAVAVDPPEPLDSEKLRMALVALAEQLALSKYSAIAAFAAIRPLLLQAGCGEAVERLHEQIDQLKFKEARDSLVMVVKTLNISL